MCTVLWRELHSVPEWLEHKVGTGGKSEIEARAGEQDGSRKALNAVEKAQEEDEAHMVSLKTACEGTNWFQDSLSLGFLAKAPLGFPKYAECSLNLGDPWG